MDIDRMVKAIANGEDTAAASQKVPFIKAKDAQHELTSIKICSDTSHQQRGDVQICPDTSHQQRGDVLLRKILASLAKGRADDQKAVAAVAKELVELGMYGPGGVPYGK